MFYLVFVPFLEADCFVLPPSAFSSPFIGLRAMNMYIGVKIPARPLSANAVPVSPNNRAVATVPAGASPTFSITAHMVFVHIRPIFVCGNCASVSPPKNEEYHGMLPLVGSRARSKCSMTSKPAASRCCMMSE